MQPYMAVASQGSDPADEWMRLGLEAHQRGQLGEAQAKYQQALRLDPRHAAATMNLAIVFAQSPGFLNEALLAIERASMFDGVMPCVPMNRALMNLEAERIDDALTFAQKALAMSPKGKDGNTAKMVMAMCLGAAGRGKEALPLYNDILDTEPTHQAAAPNACFVQTLTDCGPAELRKQRDRWYAANKFTGEKKQHANDKRIDRPLRIGYVSGDYKHHSASIIFSHVLLHHTPAVEMYLYSSLPVNPVDGKTKAFAESVGAKVTIIQPPAGSPPGTPATGTIDGGRWRDISALDDEKAEEMIRKDRIDILVDLAAHTAGGRLALFTRKPAPIQVTAWGFAHGTGCPEIDYFFADPVAIPEEERQHYAEKIIDLPCIVTYEPPDNYDTTGTSKPPLKKNGYITFGSYTRYEKISDKCLETFANILRRVPDARLEFKDNAFKRPYSIKRVMGMMPSIEPERLLFSIATDHRDHMLSYQQCDVFLNPFPHSSGVVSGEVLYMGVPMVTLNGTQAAGRSAASVLTVLGRTGWIAKTPDEYVEIAVNMANDTKGMAEARKTLRQELVESPVIKGYIEAVEAKYKEIWKEYCSK